MIHFTTLIIKMLSIEGRHISLKDFCGGLWPTMVYLNVQVAVKLPSYFERLALKC